MIYLFLVILFSLAILLFAALGKVAKREEERAERQYKEYIEGKGKNDNDRKDQSG